MGHEGPRQVCQSIELVQPELHESIDFRILYQLDILQESSLYSALDLSFSQITAEPTPEELEVCVLEARCRDIGN